MKFVFTSINSSVHIIGQGVLRGLQTLLFYLVDMHRPSLNIEEVMEFQIGLSVKQIMEFACLENLRFFSSVWTFETNAS
jgi:hypothetical protein